MPNSPKEAAVYGAHWRKLRPVILERDGYLCQIRGPRCTTEADQVDHIIPWRAGGAMYDPDNLRAACGTCNKGRARRDGVGSTNNRRPKPSREW